MRLFACKSKYASDDVIEDENRPTNKRSKIHFKTLQNKLLKGTNDETSFLLDKEVRTYNSNDDIQSAEENLTKPNQEENTKNVKKKKRLMKRIGKATLTTCRYIGIGINSLSSPVLMPHSGFAPNYHYETSQYPDSYKYHYTQTTLHPMYSTTGYTSQLYY